MTWKQLGDKIGLSEDAVRMKAKRSDLSKEDFLVYIQNKASLRKTHERQTDFKKEARYHARKKEAEVLHRHHWSYREQDYTDTILISVEDHHKLHRYLTYDPQEKMYRDSTGALLTTKASHIALLTYIKTL